MATGPMTRRSRWPNMLSMNTPHSGHDIYLHVRVMIGIIVGLSVARLLTGMSRFIQHPKREHVYLVHLGWAIAILLSVVHFWWWEFRLQEIADWYFEEYACVLFYAILFFLLSTILFPDKLDEYKGFKDYFISRKRWFFGILALTFMVDVWDTLLKGNEYAAALGMNRLGHQTPSRHLLGTIDPRRERVALALG